MLNQLRRPSPHVFLQWGSTCRYVVAQKAATGLEVISTGTLEPSQELSLAECLRDELANRKLRCRNVVLLLPRTAIELTSLSVPAATEDELPSLIHHAAALELDDPGTERVTDFFVTREDEDSCEALAYSVSATSFAEHQQSFKDAGFQLTSVTNYP